MKLHLGCGWRNFGNKWIHIDGGNYEHVTHNDITKLPYQDNTVKVIYASHVLCYFDRYEVPSVLTEWYRVLEVGGTLRLAVPDFGVLNQLYVDKKITLDQMIGPLYGRMPMNNCTIYHKTTYDYISLTKLLTSVGFNDISYYDWRLTDHCDFDDHSQAYIPHMDKVNGTLISLNIEAIKTQ